MTDNDFKQSIVGIRAKSDAKNKFAGTGFVIQGGVIVTCAHVIDAADNRDGVYRFQFEEGDRYIQQAHLVEYDNYLDIAILKPLKADNPATPLPLRNCQQSWGHSLATFGYPQTGSFRGLHGAGKILGTTTDAQKRRLLEFESDQVTHGYSGAPVWDEALGAVVGMVCEGFDFGLDKKHGSVGFAVPSEIILTFYQPTTPPPVTWNLKHPYGQQENFTGRKAELADLTAWLTTDPPHPLLIVRALGGFGKSALTWHWLTHQVARENFKVVLWWSFYEGDASFEAFLIEALTYLTGSNVIPASQHDQVTLLLNLLRNSGVLLVLDGFERALRAFGGLGAAYQGDDEKAERGYHDHDCISPAAETFLYHLASLGVLIKAKVLMTTRLRPRSVEKHNGLLAGCREIELTALAPGDAVLFFQAQGIQGTHTEIEAACAPYGYHPLSLRLLAGVIANDFKYPNDIRAAGGLDISGDLVQRQHHVLERAYTTLPPAQITLLGRVACFRSGVAYDTLQAIADLLEKELDTALRDLISRGLLQRQRSSLAIITFDLHPIVRRYAYDHFAAPDRAAAHTRLRDYFEAVPKLEKPQKLEDLAPLIELYHHTVRAGRLDEAVELFSDRLVNPLYYQLGAYQTIIELLRALFLDGEDAPPRLKREDAQAWMLNTLASAYNLSGQPRRAVPLCELTNDIYENRMANKQYLAIGLGNLALKQLPIGALRVAEANLRRSIDLCREIGDEFNEAISHQKLGHSLAYRGVWEDAERELSEGLALFIKTHSTKDWLSKTWAYRSQASMMRGSPLNIVRFAKEALNFSIQGAKEDYPIERDFIRDYWLLGAGLCAAGQLAEAETHLSEALQRCRANNTVEAEAEILLDIARLRLAQSQTSEVGRPGADVTTASASKFRSLTEEAQRLAQEALLITERSGYVLQGADVHLFLAKLIMQTAEVGQSGADVTTGSAPDVRSLKANALKHAREALRLAACDGEGYRYQVAYDEALAMIAQLEEGA